MIANFSERLAVGHWYRADKDQNNKNKLNAIQDSQDPLWAYQCLIFLQTRFEWFWHLMQSVFLSQEKSTNIKIFFPPNIEEEEEQHLESNHVVLNEEQETEKILDPQKNETVLTFVNELLDGSESIFRYLSWGKSWV